MVRSRHVEEDVEGSEILELKESNKPLSLESLFSMKQGRHRLNSCPKPDAEKLSTNTWEGRSSRDPKWWNHLFYNKKENICKK